jgi:spore maturation protein CgeB
MKILLPNRPGGAFGYISDGWMNALRSVGFEVMRYDGDEKSWTDFDPDLYIGCSGHPQPMPKNRRAKVAFHVNPYGPVKIDGINEQQRVIDWVLKRNPDAVFGYGFDDDRLLWSYWTKKHGIPWTPMPTAVDTVIFKHKRPLKNRPNDVVYLGGRWAYKAITIDAFLKPVLKDKRLKIKLHGWGDWYPNTSSGILPEDKANDFLNSGKVAPCVSERHTQINGFDVPERCWKVAACGCLAIHDPVPSLKTHFKSCIVVTKADEMLEKVHYYSRPENQDERCDLVKMQMQEVLGNHTYHDRMARLLDDMGFANEARKLLDGKSPRSSEE